MKKEQERYNYMQEELVIKSNESKSLGTFPQPFRLALCMKEVQNESNVSIKPISLSSPLYSQACHSASVVHRFLGSVALATRSSTL